MSDIQPDPCFAAVPHAHGGVRTTGLPSLDRQLDLTHRQTEIIELLSQGLRNKQIAYRLGVSDATVKAHIAKSMSVTGCNSRISLVLFWLRQTGHLI